MHVTMKILLTVLLVTVSLIHGSTAGCCGCKDTINDQLTEFYKKISNKIDLFQESRTNETGGGTECPTVDSSGCPGLLDASLGCPPIKFKEAMDKGPQFTVFAGKRVASVVSSDYDLLALHYGQPYVGIEHYNLHKYCGLHRVEKTWSDFPVGISYGFHLDIFDGKVYMTSYTKDIWSKSASRDSKWVKFLSGVKNNAYAYAIKWSKDGEKLFLGSSGSFKPGYVYSKNKELIGEFKNCGKSTGTFSFNADGNLQMTTLGEEICLYNKDNYELISQFKIPGATGLVGMYTHCDGTMIVADRGNKLFFLDKNYKVIDTAQDLGGMPGRYQGLAVTAKDGYLHVGDSNNGFLYKYKIF